MQAGTMPREWSGHEQKKENPCVFEKPEIPSAARAAAVRAGADAGDAVFCDSRL